MVGHTILELLVALVIGILVLTAALGVALPLSDGTLTVNEHADVYQRLRTAVEMVRDDLASSWDGYGAVAGVFGAAWPPVRPCGWSDDPITGIGGLCARPDVFTIVRPLSPLVLTIRDPMAGPEAPITVGRPAGCPPGQGGCEFEPGDHAIVADGHGATGTCELIGVGTDGTPLFHAEAIGPFAAGAAVVDAQPRTYYLDPGGGSTGPQLRRRDADSPSQPVVDHLVAFQIEYLGTARAPRVEPAENGTWTASYGPAPVANWHTGTAVATCAFDSVDGVPVSRLADLPGDHDGLCPLPLGRFLDGPWCTDGSGGGPVDLDLFRIRRVHLTLRSEAQPASVRGTGGWFSRPGSGRHATRLVPDVVASVELRVPGGGR